MHRQRYLFALLGLIALLFSGFRPQASQPVQDWRSRVDPWVLTSVAQGDTEFLVFLSEQADLSKAASLPTKVEKGAYVYQQLTAEAERTQGPLLSELAAAGVPHRPYWVANMIWVRGGMDLVSSLASRPDVAHIYANPLVKFEEPSQAAGDEHAPGTPDTIEWNISMVHAPQVWLAGYTGQGAVIGGQDTGYQWDHPALINHYRGYNGIIANHNYNWHDAIHSGAGSCGANSPVPCDDFGHGTHTMGTMVGDDGTGNQIGMSPGARWIGCRNMNVGVGSPATYSECYQWFIAPTDLSNQNPRPELAPDVINNSWGCPPSEGCTDPNVLLTVVNNVRAAGIVTAHSAGNSGSACSTVSEPAAIYANSFTVGATDNTDTIAGFSSRGPVTIDGSNRLKPNVSAPGVNIRSSIPSNGYAGGWSGTSMAAPHVAGLVALLISSQPSLAGHVDEIETLIERSAVPRTTMLENCGGVPGTTIPNNTYGWGRIDALAAYQRLHLNLKKSASSASILPGSVLTYTLAITNTQSTLPLTNLVLTDTLPTGTNFFGATPAFSRNGDTLRWDFSQLTAGTGQTVHFSVQVPITSTGQVINHDYGVHSAEVTRSVTGPPVATTILAPGVAISPPFIVGVMPGTTITLTHTLTNTGYATSTYNLEVAANPDWIIGSIPPNITLGPGQSAQIELPVLVPAATPGGTSATISWTAEMVGNPAVHDNITDTLIVLYGNYLPFIASP